MANLVAQNYVTFGPTERQILLDRYHQSPVRHSPIRIPPSPLRIQPSPLRQSPLQPSPLRLDTVSLESTTPKSPLMSPSPARPNNKENHTDRLCKRRIDFPLQQKPPKRATVARRNERERNRVKLVNLGFATLREHVPSGKNKKKMSKVDTLRSAADYIRHLKQILGDENALKGYRFDLRSPADSASTGYASDCSGEHGHDDEEYLDFSSWFK